MACGYVLKLIHAVQPAIMTEIAVIRSSKSVVENVNRPLLPCFFANSMVARNSLPDAVLRKVVAVR